MEKQLAQVLAQMAETMRGLQTQQANLQQALIINQDKQNTNISGINLQPYDEVNETFESYIQRLQNYITLKNVSDPTVKLQLFLNCIGPKYYQVLKNLTAPETPESKTYETLINTLKDYIAPEPGEVAQQHKFCLRTQQEQESLSNYVSALKALGGKCNFVCGSCKKSTFETHLRVQFIRGLRNSEIKERLLQEASTTSFDQIIKTAMAIETSKCETKEMESEYHTNINKISFKRKNTYKQNSNENTYNTSNKNTYKKNTDNKNKVQYEIKCYRCGKDNHKAHQCRLKNKLFCKNCNMKGHIESVCFKVQKQLQIYDTSASNESDNEEIFEIHKIHTENTNTENDKFNITLQLNGKIHTWELDTGAAVSTCSEQYYKEHFSNLKLQNTKIKLKTYTDEIIQPIGTCLIQIKYKNKEVKERLFIINRDVDPVVGREWIRKLCIHFEIHKLNKEENDITEKEFKIKLESLLKEYEDLFVEQIGEIKNYEASFKLKENVKPVFMKPRPVPFALRDMVEQEIDRLEEIGILEKVTYSQWGTPVVPVVKPTGQVRLCADYRSTLNKNLQSDNYPIPRIEEIFSKLSGGKHFCTLDIKQAYLHMKTDAATSEMQAISTCKGTYKVKRLMFGVKIAPNIWQRYMDQTLQGLPGTACFFDDIALQGETYLQLLQRIKTVFEKLQKCGLHINKKKCQFFKKSINYLGHTINAEGLHPTEEKVKDIKKSPRPTDVSSLRTFLGMINYYQQFIPNLASKLSPLYQLLHKNTKFVWSRECEEIFHKLKEEICSEKILTPFQVHLPITLATDASPTGYGAVLSHIMPDKSERPIAFASRSLTKAEKGYSQLDKEAAALIWGLKKFFQYCYGRKITLIIDNQPLARILHPEKAVPATTAIRLVHYANFLAGFDYNIKLRKTTEHANADYFSRLEHKEELKENLTDDDIFYLKQVSILPVTFQTIQKATAKDTELQQLYQEIQSGKGNKKELHEYSLQNNCIFYGIRIVIPRSLQQQILQELHMAHTGMVKMKSLARSYVWWKNIDVDIEQMVKKCKTCCQLQRNPNKVQTHSWEYPKEPWNRIHIDYAGPFMDNYFLVVVDAYTKWLEVIPTTSITSAATIKILKNLFTTFGLPVTIVSDNGRQFRSEEMQMFLKENGIQSKFTAPFHPSTNGQAERYVQTFKRKLKAMMNENGSLQDKLSKFLIAYRKTPNTTTGISPAEMMFKRLYRTRLDLVKRNLCTEINNKREEISDRKYFKEGDRVQVRSYNDDTKWKFGIITNRTGKLHYEVDINGKKCHRHVDQMLKTTCNENYNDKTSHNKVYQYREQTAPPTPKTDEKATEKDVVQMIPEEPEKERPTICDEQPIQFEENRQGIHSENIEQSPGLRRSTRLKKAPTRLDL